RKESLVPQRNHRFDASCPACREIACPQRHDCQEKNHANEGERVGWAHQEQKSPKQSRESEGAEQTESDAGGNHPHPMTKDKSQHAARRGAESHPDSDFASSLSCSV